MLSVLRYEQARAWMLALSAVEICAWWLNICPFASADMSVTHFPTTWPVHPQWKQTPSCPFEFPQSKSSNFSLEPSPPLPWWPPLWAYSRDSSLITESVGAEKEGCMVSLSSNYFSTAVISLMEGLVCKTRGWYEQWQMRNVDWSKVYLWFHPLRVCD